MFLLYDILIHLSLIILLPYFVFKMLFIGKYRQGILERFGFLADGRLKNLSAGEVIWFHAVSVGEAKAVMPLAKAVKEKHPQIQVVFSTVTTTGNAVAIKEGSKWIDSLIYFPLDFYWIVSRVVKKLKPKVFVVVEKEIWPNVLRVFKKNGIPVLVVNGSISDRSFRRYQRFGFFFKKIFGSIACFLGQTKEYADKAVALGVNPDRAQATGNMKFDLESACWNPSEKDGLMRRLHITDGDRILIAGSTHAGEEGIILDGFKMLKKEFTDLRLILAPRHPERFDEVERLTRERGFSIIKRSQEPEVRSQERKDVILLDTIGELCNFYSIATIAFVGGTLVDIGGHNLLEPAVYKKPVMYGPYLKGYGEMADMLERVGGGIRINNEEEFFHRGKELLADETCRQNAGDAAYSVIAANKGATAKNLSVLESYLQ